MSMFSGAPFGQIFTGFIRLFWVAVFMAPLAIWKLIDIGVWLFGHLHWSQP